MALIIPFSRTKQEKKSPLVIPFETVPRGFILTKLKETTPKNVLGGLQIVGGVASSAFSSFAQREAERRSKQTLGQQAVTELVKQPLKILGKTTGFLAGAFSETGKTLMEAALTFIPAAFGKDVGKASLKAQEIIKGDKGQQELEKKLFGFNPQSYTEYVEAGTKYLENNADATPTEIKTLPIAFASLMMAGDLITGGGKSKLTNKALKELIESTTPDLAKITMIRYGLPEELAERSALNVSRATTAEAVETAIKGEAAKLIQAGVDTKTQLKIPFRTTDTPIVSPFEVKDSTEALKRLKASLDTPTTPKTAPETTIAPKFGAGQPSDILGTRTSRMAKDKGVKYIVEQLPGRGFFAEGGAIPFAEKEAALARSKKLVRELNIDPLVQEARKYKSAEEFVNNQRKVFRGGTAFDPSRVSGKGEVFEGISLTTDAERAKFFTAPTQGKGGEKARIVQELFIDNNAKIANKNDIPVEIWESMEVDDIAKLAKSKGFDGVDLREVPGFLAKADKEIRIFNSDVLKTKSQLTDIWNKAVGETKPKIPETIKQKTIRQGAEITYKQLDDIAKKLANKDQTKQSLEQLKVEIDIAEKIIENMPGKQMIKFQSRGRFEDFRNPNLAKTPKEAERIRERNAKVIRASESAFQDTKYSDQFDNPDAIREAIDEYTGLRDRLKTLKESATESRKELSAVRKGEFLMELAKGNRRAAFRALGNAFNLTDAEIAKIRGKKDIMAMTEKEFNNFLDLAEIEARNIEKISEAKVQLKGTIYDKELKKWENVQQAMKLPTIDKMDAGQLRELEEVLSQYKQGDEFLTTRQLETIDKTVLKGLRTHREVLEFLAKETGVTPEAAGVAKPHPWMYDTQLQRQDPFNKLLVEKYNVSYLKAAERSISLVIEDDKLIKAARKSRPRTLGEKLIPTDKNIRKFLEAEPSEKAKIAKELTSEELKAAEFQDEYFREIYDWMTKREIDRSFHSRFEDKYFPHIRRGFLEAWKDDGFIKAFGETTRQFKQDEAVMTIVNEKTGDILPYQKWVKFEQFRVGDLVPSQNAALAFKVYVHAIEKAKQFDEFIPEMMIYAHTLSPRVTTARGLEMDDTLQQFFKKWINSKKGRVEKQIITPGSKADWALRTSVALLRVRDLGLNLGTQAAAVVGEQAGNIVMLRTKYPIGIVRLATKQGRMITKKYENFVGKSIYERFTEASTDVGDKLMTGIMGIFGSATRKSNQTFLLSMMTKEEFQAGTISVERLAFLRNKVGRYRVVEGAESIIGKSVEMAVVKQHKKWAIPIIVTSADNFKILAKNVKKDGVKALKSEEGAELFTATLLTAAIGLGSYGYYQDLKKKGSERNVIEDLAFKITRESLSMIGALNPIFIVGFAKPRLVQFLLDIAEALTSIAKLEEYQTGERKGDLKGVQAFKRAVTPVVVKQILPEEKKGSTVGGLDFGFDKIKGLEGIKPLDFGFDKLLK